MKKYLLFDLDGTLTDPKLGITTCVQYALRSFGIEEPDLDKLEPFIGPPLKDSFMEFYNMSGEQAEEAVAKYRERFRDTGIFENQVYAGIPGMLRTLQKNGLILAVASSKPEVFVERILEHFKLRDFFQVVVGSELDGTRGNKDEVVQEVLQRLFNEMPIQRDQVYMIGDRRFDVEGAKRQQIESVGVTYGYGSMEELQEARADYIVQSVEELELFLLREAEEVNPGLAQKKTVWALESILILYLLFQIVRGLASYLFDLSCMQLWGRALPAALERFLFVNDVVEDQIRGHFSGNQKVLSTAAGFIAAGLAMWIPAKRVIKKTARETRLYHLRKDPVKCYLLFVGATFGAVTGLNLVMELSGAVYRSQAYLEIGKEQYSAAFPIGLLAYGVISPIAEELLFRGVIHNNLRDFMGVKSGILFSSFFFGYYHGNIVQGIYGFMMGCLIAYAYEYFGSFRMAIAIHMIANILAYCLSGLPIWNTFFVSWPVCLLFMAVMLFCLWGLGREKDIF